MGFKCGIIGLPNVGKSTLFNALTATMMAEAANYPFCTIEPNIGKVSVPDQRIFDLASIAKSEKIIPIQIEFVDIAGLVRGASKGEGLGNQFLGHIREVDALIHVLRCFNDKNISHVEETIDPIRDAELIEMELIFADLESIEKRIPLLEKKAKTSDNIAIKHVKLLKEIKDLLLEGKPARKSNIDKDELKLLQLLTSKPILYVCNVLEDDASTGNVLCDKVISKAKIENIDVIIISSKIEAEISILTNDEERIEFLKTLGLKETGLNQIIKAGYDMLGLKTFFTVGPKEARSWNIKSGSTAKDAAGTIHTDFAKGFIKAETISYNDYINYNGEHAAKEAGKVRLEGKDYIVQDGDIFHFRFNV